MPACGDDDDVDGDGEDDLRLKDNICCGTTHG